MALTVAPVHESYARAHVPEACVVLIPVAGTGMYVALRTEDAKPGAPVGSTILPGGHVEPGETPEAAALREVMEETRLSIRLARPLGRLFVSGGDLCDSTDVQFFEAMPIQDTELAAIRGSEEGRPVVASKEVLMGTELGAATLPLIWPQ